MAYRKIGDDADQGKLDDLDLDFGLIISKLTVFQNIIKENKYTSEEVDSLSVKSQQICDILDI